MSATHGDAPIILVRAVLPPLKFDERRLQAKFKHAPIFDIIGQYSLSSAARFRVAIEAHINLSATLIIIKGTYRQKTVYHCFNPATDINAIFGEEGDFKSVWKLNPDQKMNLLARGSL